MASILLALLLVFSSHLAAETRRAVVVGINVYHPANAKPAMPQVQAATAAASKSGRGTWFNLDGSVNDATAMAAVLEARYGFQHQDVHILTDQQATRDGIRDAIRKYLIDPAQPGDISLFFYAGHGSQMKNSKSNEADKYDETIVPADSYTEQVPDVRDKELARLFNSAIDKGVLLTAILDSCHSGSIARGISQHPKVRVLPPDERDAADPPDNQPAPEERSAVIFSAAQDTQLAEEGNDTNGVPHGAFTAALLSVLTTAPLDESADDIFRQVRAIMQNAGHMQEPVLAGTVARRAQPFLGTSTSQLPGKPTLAVRKVNEDGSVDLNGGLSIGAGERSELVPVNKSSKGIRLRITEQTIALSKASVISGNVQQIKPGDLFVIDRWVPAGDGLLPVYVPPANLALNDLLQLSQSMEHLRGAASTADPVKESPTHVISWTGSVWELTDQRSNQTTVLGKQPDLTAVMKDLAAPGTKLFVDLPLPSQASGVIEQIKNQQGSVRLSDFRHAKYLLAGRSHNGHLEYAWIRPNAVENLQPGVNALTTRGVATSPGSGSSLPLRSSWVDAGTAANTASSAAQDLVDLAQRLGRVSSWLLLSPPPDDGSFPYHLEIVRGDSEVSDGVLYNDGSTYGLALRADPADLKRYVEPRWVYIFIIDSSGRGQLLFPSETSGNVENKFPMRSGADSLPTTIKLPTQFRVGEPYGTDTYLMLTTADPIDPTVLNFEGVGEKSAKRGLTNPLEQLLSTVGRRGAAPVTPATWSLERIAVRSAPKS